MIRKTIAIAFIASPMIALIAACTTAQLTTSLADLQKGCAAFEATAAVADGTLTGGAKATADKVAAPGAAFCALVDAGTVPTNADLNSVPWLTTNITGTINTIVALAKGA